VVDVEELVEEEVVQDDMHEQHVVRHCDMPRLNDEYDDLPEDSLDGGWDTEFEEDMLASQENPDPFYDGVRQLEGGHTYLTVRHRRT
ncbi:hypothetical protein, partial [Natrialba sp. PRR66]|uniref:hypothetical protein n=1 Tax=Natrialba sp. PRR66 TaxID=3098146 RepID=UPI002B1E8BC9